AESRAGGDGREHHARDLAEHRDLRAGRVGDVPEHVGADLVPRRLRGAPALLQLREAPPLVANHAQLAALDVTLQLRRLDLAQLLQKYVQLVRAPRPIGEPSILELLAL